MRASGIKKFDETKRFLSMADYTVSTTPYLFGPNQEMVCFDSYVFEQSLVLSRDVTATLETIGAVGNMEHPFWSYIRLNHVYFWDLATESLRALLRGWLRGLRVEPKKNDLELWNRIIDLCSCSYKQLTNLSKSTRIVYLIGNFVFQSVKMHALIKLMLYIE